MGLRLDRIGINVFPPQFQGDVLLNAIDDALRETRLPPRPFCREQQTRTRCGANRVEF